MFSKSYDRSKTSDSNQQQWDIGGAGERERTYRALTTWEGRIDPRYKGKKGRTNHVEQVSSRQHRKKTRSQTTTREIVQDPLNPPEKVAQG